MASAIFLGTDMKNADVIPYFAWDDPMTVRQIHEILRGGHEAARFRLLGKILREARDTEVWAFTTPAAVARDWEKLRPYLGRRRAFWEWLLQSWREEGLLAR